MGLGPGLAFVNLRCCKSDSVVIFVVHIVIADQCENQLICVENEEITYLMNIYRN